MNWMRKIIGFLGLFGALQISFLLFSQNVCAPGYISLSIQAEPPSININQSNEPVIMHCTISFDGVSVMPYTIYMNGTCDVGEVYLTQYQFVFHYPETIPFDAIIHIDPSTQNNTQGEFVLSGYYSEGGLQYTISPVGQIIEIYNYDPDHEEGKEIDHIYRPKQSHDFLFYCGLPSFLFFLGAYLSFIRPRMLKYGKKRK
jgi:hypothetical protein